MRSCLALLAVAEIGGDDPGVVADVLGRAVADLAAAVEHQGAVKGDDDWSDLTACTNEKCPEYVP